MYDSKYAMFNKKNDPYSNFSPLKAQENTFSVPTIV